MSQLPLFDASAAPPPLTVPLLERRRGTSFYDLPVRTALNSPAATGMNFWSLNPYVGCEFGCAYCYARDAHRYTVERLDSAEQRSTEAVTAPRPRGPAAPPWLAFERRILVKQDLAAVLAATLNPAQLAGETLVIGTATDPYQPAERIFHRTRDVLETLCRYRGFSIGIITKSPLVARDADVLRHLSERHDVSVSLSLITVNARLARRLEPRSPVPRARLRALAQLRQAGVDAGLSLAPVLPGLTDGRPDLKALFRAARMAGATYVSVIPLRLDPVARRRFFPVLEREFPEMVARYHAGYGDGRYPRRAYSEALFRRVRLLQARYGFPLQPARRRGPRLRSPADAGADDAAQASLWRTA